MRGMKERGTGSMWENSRVVDWIRSFDVVRTCEAL